MNCIICNNSTKTLYANLRDGAHPNLSDVYTLKKCNSCKVIFIDPPPVLEELIRHEYHPVETVDNYSKIKSGARKRMEKSGIKDFLGMLVAREFFGYDARGSLLLRILLWPLRFRFNDIPYCVRNGKLLDVGCGNAVKMPFFKKLGWEVEGIELNQRSAKIAKELGFKVYVGPAEAVDLPKDYFDVVFMNHILEHLRNPKALLRFKRTLRPGGELIITVPNSDSLAHRIFGRYWFAFQLPGHIFTYNKQSLETLLRDCGFQVKEIAWKNTLNGLASTLLYRTGKHFFFEKIAHFLSVFLDPLLNTFGLGGYITVRARKSN